MAMKHFWVGEGVKTVSKNYLQIGEISRSFIDFLKNTFFLEVVMVYLKN